MVYTSEILLKTTRKSGSLDITGQVESIVHKSGIHDGMVLVFTGHTTAGIYLGNTDRFLPVDIDNFLEEQIPNKPSYLHNQHGGGNASAHLKQLLVGSSVVIPVSEGRVDLGQWQGIFLYELDGPRRRTVIVKVIGDPPAETQY